MQNSHINTCLLVVIGIPGSGKTTLTRSLVEQFQVLPHHTWVPLAVHFDVFYPPDLRLQDMEPNEIFVLKDARRKVMICVERFILENNLGTCCETGNTDAVSTSTHSAGRPAPAELCDSQEWKTFTDSVRTQLSGGDERSIEERLGIESHSKEVVLLLDDNMPLRSMRYEYYQLARKYGLGFAQVCVQCPIHVAKKRNLHRPNPIPDSTIELMEQSMEYPDPDQNHWEKLNVCVDSEGDLNKLMHEGCQKVIPLIEEALSNPVQPLPKVDPVLKESCQLANIDSYIHQADKILRKCVSRQLETHSSGGVLSKEDKAKLARGANQVRKQLLDELRHGEMSGTRLDSSTMGHPLDDKFKELIETSFAKLLSCYLDF